LGRREVHTEFLWGNLKDRDHLEDLGVDGRKIFVYVFNICRVGDMNWMYLAQDGGRWWAHVKAVMILRVQ
jgi:hypothetical protein